MIINAIKERIDYDRLTQFIEVTFIMAITLVLRLYNLNIQMWYDEVFTGLVTRLDPAGILKATMGDVHPPLYYLITWISTRLFGDVNELTLRLPSVLASVASVYVLWLLLQHYKVDRSKGYVIMGIFALLPSSLHYGQEARMYAIFQLVYIGLVLSGVKRNWIMVGILAPILPYLQNYGWFYLATVGLFLLWNEYRQQKFTRFPTGLLAFLTVPLVYAPWAIYGLSVQMAKVADGYWILPVTAGTVAQALLGMIWGVSLPQWAVMSVYITTLTIIGVATCKTVRTDWHWLIWLGFAPMAMAILASAVFKPIFIMRALVPLTPFIVWMVVNAFWGSTKRNLFAFGTAAIIMILACCNYYSLIGNSKSDGGLAERVFYYLEAGQPVYYVGDGPMTIMSFYHPELENIEITVCGGTPGGLTPTTREAFGWTIQEPDRPGLLLWAAGPLSPLCETQQVVDLLNRTDAKLITELKSDELVKVTLWQLTPKSSQ